MLHERVLPPTPPIAVNKPSRYCATDAAMPLMSEAWWFGIVPTAHNTHITHSHTLKAARLKRARSRWDASLHIYAKTPGVLCWRRRRRLLHTDQTACAQNTTHKDDTKKPTRRSVFCFDCTYMQRNTDALCLYRFGAGSLCVVGCVVNLFFVRTQNKSGEHAYVYVYGICAFSAHMCNLYASCFYVCKCKTLEDVDLSIFLPYSPLTLMSNANATRMSLQNHNTQCASWSPLNTVSMLEGQPHIDIHHVIYTMIPVTLEDYLNSKNGILTLGNLCSLGIRMEKNWIQKCILQALQFCSRKP